MKTQAKKQLAAELCVWLNHADKATSTPDLVASHGTAASILRRYGAALVIELRTVKRSTRGAKK